MIDYAEWEEPEPRRMRPLRRVDGSRTTTRVEANRRDCSYKQQFRTRGDARRACATRVRGRRYGDGPPASPYRCPFGSHWHIGHTNQPGT